MRLFVFRVDRMWVCVGTAIRVFECGVGFVLPVGVAGHTSYTSDDDVLAPGELEQGYQDWLRFRLAQNVKALDRGDVPSYPTEAAKAILQERLAAPRTTPAKPAR